jgi:hypothetical protein
MEATMRRDELGVVVAGTWSMLCHDMRLSRGRDGALVASGSGRIGYESDGSLWFTLVATVEHEPLPRRAVGTLVEPESYLDLTSIDEWGRTWRASRVLVDREDWRNGVRIFEGQIWQLVWTKSDDGSDRLAATGVRLLIPEAVELRHNRPVEVIRRVGSSSSQRRLSIAASEVSAAGFAMTIAGEEGGLSISIAAESGGITARTEAGALEALRFVTARPLSWVIAERTGPGWEQVELRRRLVRGRPNRWLPPIDYREDEIWPMFGKYFEHVAARDCEIPQISVRVEQVIEASNWSTSMQALVFGAAVEGVLSSEFRSLDVAPAVSEDQKQDAIALIEASNLPEIVRNRLLNRARELTAVTPKMKLGALVEKGVCTSKVVEAFFALRHPHVHGRAVPARATQRGVDDLLSALSLFHRLVLAAIGYSWPMRGYAPPGDDTEARWQTVSFTAPSP